MADQVAYHEAQASLSEFKRAVTLSTEEKEAIDEVLQACQDDSVEDVWQSISSEAIFTLADASIWALVKDSRMDLATAQALIDRAWVEIKFMYERDYLEYVQAHGR